MKFEITDELFNKVIIDLRRKHRFAYERVGYLLGDLYGDTIIFEEWLSFDDDLYVNNSDVGARIGVKAMSILMKKAFKSKKHFFHTHIHDFQKKPSASYVDGKSWQEVCPALYDFVGKWPHGGVIIGKKYTLIKYWVNQYPNNAGEIFIEKGFLNRSNL